MAQFLYHNGYDGTKQRADEYVDCDQILMEVWTNKVSFKNEHEKLHYFTTPHTERCLTVELDTWQTGYEGIHKVVYFIDRKQIDLITDTIPTEAEAITILQQYG